MGPLFWFSTLLPGFALLQAVWRHGIRRGLLGTISLSFVLSVALTTPIVAVAHLLHLTTPAVGMLYLALLAVSLGGIVRFTRWRNILRPLRATHWPELAMIAAVITFTALVGGDVTHDSLVHTARIRYLRDVGFYLQDPYSPMRVMDSRYPVNTYQALYAIGCWLTREDPLELWFRSAWFFRLLGFGALEFLAVTFFRRRWVGSVAMLGAVGLLGTIPRISYPTITAGFVFLPILLAQVFEVFDRPTRLGYLKIALSSLAFGATHVGLWLIAAICVMPSLLGWSGWRKWRGGSSSTGLLAALALLAGVVFLVLTAVQPNYIMEQEGALYLWMLQTLTVGGRWHLAMFRPGQFLWLLPVAAALALLLTVRKPIRTTDILVVSIPATAVLYMFNPVLLTPLMKFIPYWIIRRAFYVCYAVGFVTIAGGIAWLMRPTLRTRTARLAFAGLVVCAGVTIFNVRAREYWTGSGLQHKQLRQLQELQTVMRPVVGARPLIAAEPEISLMLPAVHLCAVMAPSLGNANPADEGVVRRSKLVEEFLARDTTPERRRAIAAQYEIEYVVMRTDSRNENREGFRKISDLVAQGNGFELFKLRP